MFKKSKYIFTFIISLSIVVYGFITVSNVLPDFIKDRSYLKVTYKSKPFDLQFDIGDYIVYLNSKALDNYRKGTNEVINKIVSINPLKKVLK
jgi:hypothetical protein